MNINMSVGGKMQVNKLDAWQSEKQMLDKFSATELVSSSRVIWKEPLGTLAATRSELLLRRPWNGTPKL